MAVDAHIEGVASSYNSITPPPFQEFNIGILRNMTEVEVISINLSSEDEDRKLPDIYNI